MRGSSRGAALAGQRAFQSSLESGADWVTLAEDLFGVAAVVDGSATLRRALADPSRDARAKRDLVARLFGGKVSQQAVDLLSELAAQRWAAERDLTDTVENLAVETVLATAEAGGRIDRVEDELFRFERIVAGDARLRDTLGSRNTDAAGKAGIVRALLEGKVAAGTIRLVEQAVLKSRGRRLDRVLESYLTLAAARRDELTALVTVAIPLDEQQEARLKSALTSIYDKQVTLQTVLDPTVVGGIRIQIGDEVVDGTVVRRLDRVRRDLAG